MKKHFDRRKQQRTQQNGQRMKGRAARRPLSMEGNGGGKLGGKHGTFAPVRYSRAMAQELNYKNARIFRIRSVYRIKMKSLKINRIQQKKRINRNVEHRRGLGCVFICVCFCLSSQTKMAL